jgi:hypothetical protein
VTGVRFAVALGVTGMYVADPLAGRRRRRQLTAQVSAARRRGRQSAARRKRLAAGGAAGDRARERGAGHFHPTDGRSVERHLHEVLSRLDLDPDDVNVEVVEGLVRVRGQVATGDDLRGVVEALQQSPGVGAVDSLLHLPGEPAPNKEPSRAASPRVTP